MPQFGPVEWLLVYLLVWISVGSMFLETYWSVPGRFSWTQPTEKKVLKTYSWRW